MNTENIEPVKRGRGRPRKNIQDEDKKEKGKPGRPRKYKNFDEYYNKDLEKKRKESTIRSISNFGVKYEKLKQKAIDQGLLDHFMKTLEVMFDDYKGIDDIYIVDLPKE